MTRKRSSAEVYTFLRRFSIRGRLRTLFFTELVLVVCWCGLAVYSSLRGTVSYVLLNNSQIVSTATENVRGVLSSLSTVTKYPVIRINQKASDTYEYLGAPWKYHRFMFEQDVKDNSRSLFEQHPSLLRLYVFDGGGDGICFRSDQRYLYYTDGGDFGRRIANQGESEWFRETTGARGREFIWSESYMSGILPENNSDREYTLFLSRSIFNTERFENVGAILASADISLAPRLFAERRYLEEERMGMFGPAGERLFGDLAQSDYESLRSHISAREATGSIMLDGGLYTYSVISEGYLCVIRTPLTPIWLDSLGQQSTMLAGLLVLLCFIALSTNMIVGSITKPIRGLVRHCNEVRERKRTIRMEDGANDELAEFTRSLSRMEDEIEELIHEAYQKDLALTQTELHMLRQQINPHFLYNTLESIRSTARRKGEGDLEEMSFLLARVLRYGVSLPDEIVTVERELFYLHDYIRLQQVHYRGSVRFNIHVDEALYERPVIKLVLQPLVENALYHGVSTLLAGGDVTVLGFLEEERMVFQVVDNGVGIGPETLDKLNGYIRGENEDFNSIGIKNVNRRIQLYYGEGWGLSMESRVNRGTMVTVSLPLKPPEGLREEG